MSTLSKTTTSLKESEIVHNWHLIDVKNKILGRITPKIAQLLQGKHKTNFVPYLDCGDYVVVINAKHVSVSGRKAATKTYTRYSGYPGGLRTISYKTLMEKNPAMIIEHAVSGMLPKNKLRDVRMKRLYIFADNSHPYEAQFKVLDPNQTRIKKN